jgi:hypothetical protein
MKLTTVRNWGEASKGPWTLVVADTKPGDYHPDNATSNCVDIPYDDDYYYYFLQDCVALLHKFGQAACDDTPKARDACCFCGGGEAASAIRDQLLSWTIVLYGHNRNDGLDTVAPSPILLDGDDSTVVPSPLLDTVAPSPLLDADDSTTAPSIQPSLEEAVVEAVPTRKPSGITANPDAVQGDGSLSSTSSSSSTFYSGLGPLGCTATASWSSLLCGSAIAAMIVFLFE